MNGNAKDHARRDGLDFSPSEDLRERMSRAPQRETKETADVTATPGPRFSRNRVGEEVRRLRTQHDLSQAELGAMVGCSGARISRLEKGDTTPDLALVMNILDALEVDAELQQRLIALAREANQQYWWRVSGMPERQAAFAELEASSRSIRQFALIFVPGLLQTPDYTQVRHADREANVPADEEAATAGRLERQSVFTRAANPVQYTAILDEGLLRRRTAPPEVLAAQWRHLAEMAALPNVEIRVLPLDAELDYFSPPLTSFALYRLTHSPDMAVVETETGEMQITDEDQIQRYEALFARVEKASLSPKQSIARITGGET
ncbi:MAG: helix-turn-helix domain-containing protein [Dehalococcoidia bacterium]